MKRLRSSDDLDSYNEKSSSMKDSNRSSSSRSFYYKSDNVRKGLISPSSSSGRYDRDRSVDDDDINGSRDTSRLVRKRMDHDFDGFDRRKGLGLGFDRYSSGGSGGSGGREGYGSGGAGGGGERSIHRSESFCGSRREFPKGFRSERERERREGSVSSWRRFGSGAKEFEENRSSRGGNEDRLLTGTTRSSPKVLRDVKSPTWSRDSGSEQAKTGRDSGGELTRGLRDGGGCLSGGGGRDELKGGWGRSSNSKSRSSRSSRSSPTWSKDSGSEQSRSVEMEGKKTIEIDGKKSVEIDGKKSVEADGKKSVETDGKKSGEIDGKKIAEMDGKKNVDIEVKRSIEMVGKTSGEVEATTKSVGMEEGKTGGSGSGSSSEMEEGELQPEEPHLEHKAVTKEIESDSKFVVKESDGDNCKERQANVEEDDDSKDAVCENQESKEPLQANVSGSKEVGKEADKMPTFEQKLKDNNGGSEDDEGSMHCDEGGDHNESLKEKSEHKEESFHDMVVEKPMHLEEESRQDNVFDLEVKAEDVEVPDSNEEVIEENGGLKESKDMAMESLVQNLKDKGKSVAVSPTNVADFAEHGAWTEREARTIAACRDGEDNMEGPSTRGFELFSNSPVRRVEKAEQSGVSKPKDEKLVLEPLDLSLSLPNVLPIGPTRETNQAPGSPSHGRSVQSFSSFRTNSDGFTASMSFSGSQSFFHNPSCSLTQNSMDMDNFEQSVHSRPIFQGVDQAIWQGQAQNESKHKDVPLYQRILMNGNGSLHQPQALQGMSNGQVLPGSSKKPNGLERQLSFHKQSLGGHARNHEDTRSPSQSVGSHDIGSSYSLEKKRAFREKHGGSLYRSNSQKDQEQFLIGGADFVETVIGRIVSDPIHVMAKKFNEMTSQSASCLKESIREIMLNADKQGQLYAFQSLLQSRSDLTLDMLLKTHRAQLEILVALKTGLPEYLQVDNSISSSDLAEVFLNLKCRNLTCRSPLPVDECDCKVCAKKNGFCSSCMCLVCSKFDMASNTCSWVGCDVCLHWCHADCALRESYIRNGKSATGAQGITEMQFHCVACDHPSEMFGFVKEVFQNFAKEWTADTFLKELEYVKRIFRASKDVRGRQLCEIADQMLAKLANKSNLPEVYSHITGFLTESDSSKYGNPSVFTGKEQGNGNNSVAAGPSQDAKWLKPVYTEKAPQLERSASLLPSYHSDLNNKHPVESDLLRSSQKEPLFDELESIVRIKLAEAKMFQGRADDARRDAEGLKQIAIAKNQKIEEEYASRIAKLRIVEAEEMRKQKFEEFQALERAHREYFNMKIRMEADIKDLLLKMEATKRNLTM